MSVSIVCPNLRCRSVLRVDEKQRGKRVRCRNCGQVILVPAKPAGRK